MLLASLHICVLNEDKTQWCVQLVPISLAGPYTILIIREMRQTTFQIQRTMEGSESMEISSMRSFQCF